MSRMILFVTVVAILSYLIYEYAPVLDIEPEAYNPQLLKFEGPLAVNQDLHKGQILFKDKLPGPESLEYKDGLIYASLADGRIVSIQDEKILKTVADTTDGSKVPGRPLGLRFFNDDLYVADMLRGLLKVDVKTGKVTVLIPTAEKIGGVTVYFPNDLDIVNGEVYFSDTTTKWDSTNFWYNIIEHRNTGRICKYNIATGKTEVVLDNLYLPNGIQSTPDKTSILISEFVNHRILRHYISGPKKGQTEVFVLLPGEPDNTRPSSKGGFWVPVIAGRDISSPNWIDRLRPYPRVIKALCKLAYALGKGLKWANQYLSSEQMEDISSKLLNGYWILSLIDLEHAVLVELSADGQVLRSFHSSTEKFGKISQALELDGYLILGSFENSNLLKLKL